MMRGFLTTETFLNQKLNWLHIFLKTAGRSFLSGVGSGLFESILKKDYGIEISHGIEPSVGMAEIAGKRGLDVKIGTAEDADFGNNEWDTLLFNGTPSYITDLDKAVKKAYSALREGGKVVMLDVPKEGSYGIIYNLAKTLGTWDHPLLEGTQPPDPYPIEFVKEANWRTTAEKIELLEKNGFEKLGFAQTLTNHPGFSNSEVEEPVPGHTRGDYVAICAWKKSSEEGE